LMVTGIRVYGATDVGRTRTSNEDCHAALVGDGCPAGIDALLIVADGLGGHAAGEVASRMAVDGMVRKLEEREDYLRSSSRSKAPALGLRERAPHLCRLSGAWA